MNHRGDMFEINRNMVPLFCSLQLLLAVEVKRNLMVFCFTKVWFTSSTSGEVQISAGCPPSLRHRHAEEQPPNKTDPLTNKDRSPTEHPCGEKVTEHDEPAHADGIIRRVWGRSSHFYLWSKFMTLPTCFAPCQAALLSPKRCVALHPL